MMRWQIPSVIMEQSATVLDVGGCDMGRYFLRNLVDMLQCKYSLFTLAHNKGRYAVATERVTSSKIRFVQIVPKIITGLSASITFEIVN